MTLDPFKNFAISSLTAGITAGAVSLTVTTGTGVKFPATAFNATIWDSTTYASAYLDPNAEIVRVTAGFGSDTFTITRAQEGTAAVAHNTGGSTYKILAGPTAKTLNTDILGLGTMRSLTTTATLTATDKFVLYDTSAGVFNVTLCPANAVPANFAVFFYGFNASGTNVITLVCAGADLIRFGGASGTSTTTASKAFTNAANARTLWSDGVQFWYFQ